MEHDLYLYSSADGMPIFKFVVTRFNLSDRAADSYKVDAIVDDGVLTEYDLMSGRYCQLQPYNDYFELSYAGDYIEMTPDQLLQLYRSRTGQGTEYHQTREGVRGFHVETSQMYVRHDVIYTSGQQSEPDFFVAGESFIDEKIAELEDIRKPYKWYTSPEDPNVDILEFESGSWETLTGRHPTERYTYTFYQPAVRNLSRKTRTSRRRH